MFYIILSLLNFLHKKFWLIGEYLQIKKQELYCDIIDIRNMFYFGRPSNGSHEIKDVTNYMAHKNLKRFHEAGGDEEGYHDTDYFYYEVESRNKYQVGDDVSFKDKKLYVNQYSAYALKEEVIYKYRLCRKNGVWQTKLYNSLIGGASLEGEVLAVEGEKVKLHLTIDESQNEEEASWFPYAPPTGNVMYSMPIVGTSARLYFPSEVSEDPIITGCVRTNGSSCAKTSDTTNRYFGTEHGSEIEMTPGAVNIKGGSKEPLSISFEDEVGVTLKSPKNLNINADDDIIIKTPANISVKAQSQIGVTKAGTENGFSVETDMHFKGGNVIKDGSCREAFAPFDDEPKAGTKPEPPAPPPEEKKPFSWGALAKNVLAGLAVVALVTVAAVAIAVTCGAAAPVIGAIAVGAVVAGTAAVASQAISDVKSGEVSDMSTYVSAGAREALIGAVSGAIFGPFGATEALGGKMLLGGVTNGFESILRQTLEGKGIDFKTVLFDVGVGAATGGLFHGAGKMFEKASPFAKKAFNKISSEISENTKIAKIAISNMQKGPKSVVLGSNLGNVDETLRRFAKEFKKAKVASIDGGTQAERLIAGTPGVVTGGSSTKLGKNLFESMGVSKTTKRTPYQAMHIIPKEFKSHPVIRKIGMDFDDASNGILLKNRKSGGISPMSRHEGNHKSFNDFIESKLDNMDINKSIPELEQELFELQQKSKKLMEEGLPMYAKENERIDKFGDIIRENKGQNYGDYTIDLWERWFNK